MLGRLFWGCSASAVAAGAMMGNVAHAAEKKPTTNEDAMSFAPVYDTEVPQNPGPLPGTVEAAKNTSDTELANAENKLTTALDMESVKANGRVFRVSSLLEKYIGSAREYADSALDRADSASSELGQKYRDGERQTVTTLAGLKGADEDMLPSTIYVLIAGLGGSIVARKHNILFRATFPWLFGGAAFAYFLPQTWSNVRQLAWKYEQEQVPTLAKKHTETVDNISQMKNQSVKLYDDSEKSVKSSVHSLRSKIKEWTGF